MPSLRRIQQQPSHCSSIVRFTPDMGDLLSAHTTWSNYQSMLRVFKLMSFPDPLDPTRNVTMQVLCLQRGLLRCCCYCVGCFGVCAPPRQGCMCLRVCVQYSSYPGSVSSTDDFFQVSTQLVVMEVGVALCAPACPVAHARTLVRSRSQPLPPCPRTHAHTRLARNASMRMLDPSLP